MNNLDFPLYETVKKVINSRRSIRYYSEKPVAISSVIECLDNARFAPSAHNRQPWRFCLISNKHDKLKLAVAMGERLKADRLADHDSIDVINADLERSYKRITESPVIIMIFLTMEDMDSYSDCLRNQHEYAMAMQSTAMAVQNILLSLSAVGLGACWMCAPLFCPDTILTHFNIPPKWDPQSLITVGYPVDSGKLRKRKKLNDITIYM